MEKSKNKIPIQKYRNSEELVQNMIIEFTKKKSESLQTEGRHFRSMICKLSDV